MQSLYVFIIRNDVWIYILAGLGLVWYLSELWRSRNILRRAMFGLERETGARMRNNALFFLALFSLIIAFVFYVNNRIAPTIPANVLKPPTPTPDIFHTPLAPPTPLGGNIEQRPSPTPPFAPTVTLPGQTAPLEDPAAAETPTATPFIPPTPFIGCTIDLNITQPANGTAVDGELTLFGSADTENFQYYTLEINGPQTNGQWADLLGRQVNQIVIDTFLGSANISQWDNGPYLIRLGTFDISDNLTGQCVIQVTLAT